MAGAAVARIERAEAVDQPLVHGALRNLVGRGPLAVVPHGGYAQLPVADRQRVAQHAVVLAIILRHVPRPVVVDRLERIEELPRPCFRRAHEPAPVRIRTLPPVSSARFCFIWRK